MAIFQVKAISDIGEELDLYVSAPSVDLAIEKVQESGLEPISITPFRSFATPHKSPLNARNLSIFFKMLSSLLTAGVPLVDSLRILSEQFAPPLSTKILEVLNDVSSGATTFSGSLERRGGFPKQVVGTLRAAEEAGKLDKVTKEIGDALAKAAYFRGLAVSSMTYPVLILSFAILVTFAMVVFLVPSMVAPLVELGVSIPRPTQILLGISSFVLSPMGALSIVGGLLGGALYLRSAWNSPDTRKAIEELILRTPIVGSLVGYSQMVSFIRVVTLALSSGLVLPRALGLTEESLSFQIYREGVRRLQTMVENGLPLDVAMERDAKLWPSVVVGTVAVGLKSGGLVNMLNQVREMYEESYEASIKGLASTLEPILLIFVGTLVGAIMLAVLMPYFSLMGGLGGG